MNIPQKNHRTKNLGLFICIILLVNILVGEVLFRVAVFSGLELFNPIRKAQYFTSYGSENYYKLKNIFATQSLAEVKRKQLFPHPELGWVGNFSKEDYQHFNDSEIKGRQVVLLFGDSFANCMNNPVDFQDILEQNKVFLESYYLLNYAVDGYGLDQIYLLLTKVLELYDHPIVLFSFTTIDLDRSVVRWTVPQKPYFTKKGDNIYLQRPVLQSIDDFITKNKPSIYSYLASFVKNIVHLFYHNVFRQDTSVFGDGEARIQPIKAINKQILTKTVALLESKNIKHKIIVFHTNWRGESPINKNDWRDNFLITFFDDLNVSPVWSKSLIQSDALKTGNPFYQYFLEDGHPSTQYIQLVATEIEKVIGVTGVTSVGR